jgi:hypothetical protein
LRHGRCWSGFVLGLVWVRCRCRRPERPASLARLLCLTRPICPLSLHVKLISFHRLHRWRQVNPWRLPRLLKLNWARQRSRLNWARPRMVPWHTPNWTTRSADRAHWLFLVLSLSLSLSLSLPSQNTRNSEVRSCASVCARVLLLLMLLLPRCGGPGFGSA